MLKEETTIKIKQANEIRLVLTIGSLLSFDGDAILVPSDPLCYGSTGLETELQSKVDKAFINTRLCLSNYGRIHVKSEP